MQSGKYVRTEAMRRRRSEAMKGKNLSDEHKRKISKALKGRRHSDEHIRNASQARRDSVGWPGGPDHPNWRGGIYKDVGKKEYEKTYRQRPENKIKHNTQSRAYYQRLKIDVLSHYSLNGVPECVNPFGEHKDPYTNLDALSIDHIHGDGAKHKREIGKSGGGAIYQWLKKQEYPEGFQTLCMNCQCIKRMKNREVRK